MPDGSDMTAASRKRAASTTPPAITNWGSSLSNGEDLTDRIGRILGRIEDDLNASVSDDTILICGLYLLQQVSKDPDHVLTVSRQAIESFHFRDVPSHWRRLYEDASLQKAAALLRRRADGLSATGEGKRQACRVSSLAFRNVGQDDWLQALVAVLDQAIMLTGAPRRKTTFDAIFQCLDSICDDPGKNDMPKQFDVRLPHQLALKKPISLAGKALSLGSFESWMQKERTPLIIADAFDHWPACHRWQDPNYLLSNTLDGRRIVPVEIGESYTSEGWTQRTMTMKDFVLQHLLPERPEAIGYLAQYDLFQQIPTLRADVSVPDYCYTDPPKADCDALKTTGLSTIALVDEPLMHAWLGPKGTKTPLHTDPYHNIFCQVVGYKYVRLYSPSETRRLYPRSVDESGISMENTSSIDVNFLSRRKPETDASKLKLFRETFPLFADADYFEGVLGPGDSLYVPLGWWHYVESLTTSFSVSFWWN
ncbi:hypothetical protein LTR78_006856 [Recurvomyces mirabilis]|uniref:JmjC domain-containing protein n=1 Tax=Recurvomyces mirabilis TaxID=574656 RepID=A0AAE1BZB7_9PEZI|nr:hypothetical protein LTR78_006856 [Recurvomyces mirabilis]KAK5153153.1 hypothetical protein LTS14_007798 [Recurvomyces mirabilis]